MKIIFNYFDPQSSVKHIPVMFERDVQSCPRIGEHVVHHKSNGSKIFKVMDVTHNYETRSWYAEKTEFNDRLFVTLLEITQEQAYSEHCLLLQKSGCL